MAHAGFPSLANSPHPGLPTSPAHAAGAPLGGGMMWGAGAVRPPLPQGWGLHPPEGRTQELLCPPPGGAGGAAGGRSLAGHPRPRCGTHPGPAASHPGRWCWFSRGHRWLCGGRRVSGAQCQPPPPPSPPPSRCHTPRGRRHRSPSPPGVPAVGLAAPAADDQDAGEQDQRAPDEDGEQREEQHVAILGGHLAGHRLHRGRGSAAAVGGTRPSPNPPPTPPASPGCRGSPPPPHRG